MSAVDQMLRRYLESARDFERAGWEATEDRDKLPLWERAALAGMCAYLLSCYAAGTDVQDVAEELASFDHDGQDLSSWVHDQLAALPARTESELNAAAAAERLLGVGRSPMCPGCLVRPLGHAEGDCHQ